MILSYLDYNATAPLRAEAKAALLGVLDETGNASSIHAFGRAARKHVDDARRALATALETAPAQVIFTGGATESNALALQGLPVPAQFIDITAHDSLVQNAPQAGLIPVDGNGLIKLDALQELLAKAPQGTLISVLWANNETGVIQPIEEIARIVKAAQGLLHVDAAQAFGRVPVSMNNIDLLSLSAHKIGGPQGVGALVVREGLIITPTIRGGGQEKGQRSGTENVAAIAGFGAAIPVAAQRTQVGQWAAWRDALATKLQTAQPESVLAGAAVPRLANTLCVIHPRLTAEIQLMKLDLAGFAVSAGSACSSGRVKESRVLEAMGMDERARKSAIRISFGWHTKPDELENFAAQWAQM